MCPMNCHPTLCGMLVEVEEGRVLKITGDEENPDSRGFLCIRGHASREIIGNPNRVLHPLVRERRGDGAWRKASWDEALDLIVERMRTAGRESVGTWSGHGLFANNYGTRIHSHLLRRFSNLYGCQWWSPTIICWGLGAFGLGLTGVLETSTKEDMGEHAALIVLWGANLASQPNTARHLAAARRRGAFVVTIDVRETEAAAHSDEVLVLRPGTDAALALGMMNVIVAERLYDREFVARHTVGFDELAAHLARHVPAWAAGSTDMLSSFADAERVAEGLARTDLCVSYDLFMNDTARRFADVVLPSTSWLEDLGCKSTNTHLYLMPRILDPPGETRSATWVLRELATRLGVADFFPWQSDEGPIDAILDHPSTGHATVAALRQERGMRALRISHVAYPDHAFHTLSGKVY